MDTIDSSNKTASFKKIRNNPEMPLEPNHRPRAKVEKITSKRSDIFENDDNAPLGYRIKRIDPLRVEHKSKLLADGSNRIIVVGGSGRGKSTVVLEILPMFTNKTTHILIASVKQKDIAFEAIERYCEFSNIKYALLSDPAEVGSAIDEIVTNKAEDEHYVVIFDDFATTYSATSKDPANTLITTAYSLLRSTNGSLIMITQSYNSIPTRVRTNVNMKIVFAMEDVFSSRAIIEDTTGMFYSGGNANYIKDKIKSIYKTLYDDFHNWLLILSNPPEIRTKWNTIVYPPNKAGEIAGGGTKKKIPEKVREKYALYYEAKELGFPRWAYKHTTPEVLRKFIDARKAGESNQEKLLEIINEDLGDKPDKMRRQLTYYIKKYKLHGRPEHLNTISEIAEKLVKSGAMTEEEGGYILKKFGLDSLFEV